MAEEINVSVEANKREKYDSLLPQLEALTADEPNLVANLANIAAALKEIFGFWWVGFYLLENDELVLGPFQGPVACTRIQPGKGVCGTACIRKETILVPDVEQFPGHIACSSASRSEIVVPVIKDGIVRMVLDVDSEHLGHFDETDRQALEKLAALISRMA
jgi:GAF domain-containing protein